MFVTTYSWAPWLQVEALKFWFYALAVSFCSGVVELYHLDQQTDDAVPDNGDEKPNRPKRNVKTRTAEKEEEKSQAVSSAVQSQRRTIYRQMTIDACDLLIPGSVVGWIPLDPMVVGVTGSLSAVLGASQVWERVNN
jgi:hypothetical protein